MSTIFEESIRHAERFGIDSVYESATELEAADRVKLKIELQRIAVGHSKNREHITWWEHPPRVTNEDILHLRDEGLTASEIVTATGKTQRAVEAILRAVEDEEKQQVVSAV